MAENDPKNNDGLSQEELEQLEASDLPNREAMSLISPGPIPATIYYDDPLLGQSTDPISPSLPVEPPEAV